MAHAIRALCQGLPSRGAGVVGPLRVRGRSHTGPGVQHGLVVHAVDVDQVAAVAEGIRAGNGYGQRLDLQVKIQHLLARILPRMQPQEHDTAVGHRLVMETAAVLDTVLAGFG